MRVCGLLIIVLTLCGGAALPAEDAFILEAELPGESLMLPVTVLLCDRGPERLSLSSHFILEAARNDNRFLAKVSSLEYDRLKRLFATDSYRHWYFGSDSVDIQECSDEVSMVVCHFEQCRGLLVSDVDENTGGVQARRFFLQLSAEYFSEKWSQLPGDEL